jgi:hypothetical protein
LFTLRITSFKFSLFSTRSRHKSLDKRGFSFRIVNSGNWSTINFLRKGSACILMSFLFAYMSMGTILALRKIGLHQDDLRLLSGWIWFPTISAQCS